MHLSFIRDPIHILFSVQRYRRSASITSWRPRPLPSDSSTNIKPIIKKRHGLVAARKVFKTAKEAFVDAVNDTNASQKDLFFPLTQKEKPRGLWKARPPPPQFISVGNQSYKVTTLAFFVAPEFYF